MNHSLPTPAQWRTTSYGCAADTLPIDLEALQAHVARCTEEPHFASVLHQSGTVLGSFLTARVITTLVIVFFATLLLRAW